MAQSPLEFVVAHWSKLFENFNISSEQFYTSVSAALERREIPDAPRYRVQWSEGGVLSPNREYLRIEGSGFACDICAAAFGTGFFFSWWLTRKRAQFVFLYLLLLFGVTWGLATFLGKVLVSTFQNLPMSFDTGVLILRFLLLNPITIWTVSLLLAMGLFAIFEGGGLRAPGEAIKTVPVLGWAYERWFSPVTFYRLDTAAMFRATVHAAVLEVIDDLTTQKGLKALAPDERRPVLRGMS